MIKTKALAAGILILAAGAFPLFGAGAEIAYNLGEVTVRITGGEKTVIGRGSSTDIIEASAKAYIDALNRLHFATERVIETL